jgi:hypothetical protein
MSLRRVRLLVMIALWVVFVGGLSLGVPPLGHPLRPLMWVAMVLLSLRVIYAAMRSNKRPS